MLGEYETQLEVAQATFPRHDKCPDLQLKLESHWAISFQRRANCGQPPQLPAIWLSTCAPRMGGEQLDTSGANTNFINNKNGRPRFEYTFCRSFSSIYMEFTVFTLLERVLAFTMLWDHTNELFTKTTLKRSKWELVKQELL